MIPFSYSHMAQVQDYYKWRTCYEGGQEFLNRYLQKFSNREDDQDFQSRKAMTPIATFAKSAINEIRNNLFQRLVGITRTGGSTVYQKAVKGEGLGVDNDGSSMTQFIGTKVLTDLLVCGKVGVYVDAMASAGQTLADRANFQPYCYVYKPEDIINFKLNPPEHESRFQSLWLRDSVQTFDEVFQDPTGIEDRYRHVWINEDGYVTVQMHKSFEGNAALGEPVVLELRSIPFVLADIGQSLMLDVCSHQIAVLNLASSNVQYGVSASFPIYTEQTDQRGVGTHLKSANADGSATTGGQGAGPKEAKVGVSYGRRYDMGADRPDFINPSSEPLIANLKLCESLKQDIRELVQLAVVTAGAQTSAASKDKDNQGLEAGLSFIGLVLEKAEREIAKHWAAYESTEPKNRQIATVAYPARYQLQTEGQRIEEAAALHDVVAKLPSRAAKKATAKLLLSSLLSSRVSEDTMSKILAEVDKANFTTSDPEIIRMAKEAGLLSAETGAIALGFDKKEAEMAATEHIDRLAAIAAHQTPPGGVNGVADTQSDANAGKADKAASRQTDNKPSTEPPVRGDGKKV